MIRHPRIGLGFHGDHVRYAAGWEETLTKLGIAAGKDWHSFEQGELASGSARVNCYRCELDNGEIIYFKRYEIKSWKPQFFYPLPSKPVVENFGFNILNKIGIPSLDVLAIGERRNYGRLHAGFIVTRSIESSIDLEKFAEQQWYDMPEPQRSNAYHQISESILQQLNIAHENNFCHKDLKWRNILVKEKNGVYATTWIDCPRAEIMRLRKKRRILMDIGALARLAMSYLPVKEQLRWLQRYIDVTGCHYTAKELFRSVQKFLRSRRPELLDVEKKPIHRKI